MIVSIAVAPEEVTKQRGQDKLFIKQLCAAKMNKSTEFSQT
jgi:hypothetical protein